MKLFRVFVLFLTPILACSAIAQVQGPVGFNYDLTAREFYRKLGPIKALIPAILGNAVARRRC